MKRMSQAIRVSGLAAMIVMAMDFAWAQFGGPMLPSVRVQPAGEQTVARSLEFSGAIEPWRRIELSAQVEGLVAEIPIEEGQRVKSGETICRLDTERAEIEVAREEALVEDAAAQQRLYEAGYRSEEVREAQKRLEEAEARQSLAREEWERQKSLVEEKVVSEIVGSRLRTAVDEAASAVAQTQANLQRLQSGYRKEEIAQAKAKAAAARADLREAQWSLDRHAITAPMEALVVERRVEPGEWVSVGDTVADLVVLDPLKVRIDVPQAYLTQVAPGQTATLTIDGMNEDALPGGRLTAEVTNIHPQAGEGSRNFTVLLKMENPGGALRAGLFARVKLAIGESKPSVMAPRRSLMIRGDTLVVLVAQPIPREAGGSRGMNEGPPPATSGGANPGMNDGTGAPMEPQPDAILREAVVRTGTEIGDMVAIEVIGGQPIAPGDLIVTLGGAQQGNGAAVRILNLGEVAEAPEAAGESAPATPATSATP
jgi:multidrug resistance efflux pump